MTVKSEWVSSRGHRTCVFSGAAVMHTLDEEMRNEMNDAKSLPCDTVAIFLVVDAFGRQQWSVWLGNWFNMCYCACVTVCRTRQTVFPFEFMPASVLLRNHLFPFVRPLGFQNMLSVVSKQTRLDLQGSNKIRAHSSSEPRSSTVSSSLDPKTRMVR